MSGLFKKPETPKLEAPVALVDPYNAGESTANRDERRRLKDNSSASKNRIASVPGTIGREYTRSNLGAS